MLDQTIDPRLESSQAYTKAPEEFDEAITELFTDHFNQEDLDGDFDSQTLIYPNEIIVRVGYLASKSIAQVNFLVSTDFNSENQDVIEVIDLMLIGLKDIFSNHFSGTIKREELAYGWSPLRGSNSELFYKYDATNHKLEDEASKLLGEEDSSSELIVGDLEATEDINNILDSLSKRKPSLH